MASWKNSRRARSNPGGSQFCSDVVQIRFNAWHYVDSNLWASLVTFILQKLAEHFSPEPSVEQKHAALMSELASAKALTAEAEADRNRAKELLDKDEEELHRVRGERQTKEIELADIRATDVAALLMKNRDVRDEIKSALEAVGVSKAINSQDDLQRAVEEARQTRNNALDSLASMAQQKHWPWYVIALIGAPLAIYLLQRYALAIDQVVSAVSALIVEVATIVAAAVVWIRRGTEIVRQRR